MLRNFFANKEIKLNRKKATESLDKLQQLVDIIEPQTNKFGSNVYNWPASFLAQVADQLANLNRNNFNK